MTKEDVLREEAILEHSKYPDDEKYAVWASAEVLKGNCPYSGHTFEDCSNSVCDCGWDDGNLPWLNP